MVQAKVTSKGQVTIPLEVRRRLRLETGSRIDFVCAPDGSVVIEAVHSNVASLMGALRQDLSARLSLGAIAEAVEEEAASRGPRPGPTLA